MDGIGKAAMQAARTHLKRLVDYLRPDRDDVGFLRFYVQLLLDVPGVAWRALGWFGNLVLIVLGALFLLNRKLAALVSSWHGISPWWVVALFGVLLLIGLARANYERFTAVVGDLAVARASALTDAAPRMVHTTDSARVEARKITWEGPPGGLVVAEGSSSAVLEDIRVQPPKPRPIAVHPISDETLARECDRAADDLGRYLVGDYLTDRHSMRLDAFTERLRSRIGWIYAHLFERGLLTDNDIFRINESVMSSMPPEVHKRLLESAAELRSGSGHDS